MRCSRHSSETVHHHLSEESVCVCRKRRRKNEGEAGNLGQMKMYFQLETSRCCSDVFDRIRKSAAPHSGSDVATPRKLWRAGSCHESNEAKVCLFDCPDPSLRARKAEGYAETHRSTRRQVLRLNKSITMNLKISLLLFKQDDTDIEDSNSFRSSEFLQVGTAGKDDPVPGLQKRMRVESELRTYLNLRT